MNATHQTIGSTDSPTNIYIDSISTLTLNLKTGSSWYGQLLTDAKSTTGVVVTIDTGSSWTLTDNSYVGNIDSASLDKVNVNGHKLYKWDTTTTNWIVAKE